MRKHSGAWTASALALAAFLAWLWMTRGEQAVEPPVLSRPGVAREHAALPVRDAGTRATGAGTSAPASPGQCPEQRLEVTASGTSRVQCVGRTQVVQNGNVRTFRVEGQGGSQVGGTGAWLRLDAAGETIVAVELNVDDKGAYTCKWQKCKGVSVGPHDAQGARSLIFDRATLARMRVVDDEATDEELSVDGRLKTIPDNQLPWTTCVGQLVQVSVGAGTVPFCPDGGTGFDREDDGGTTYRFTNADGAGIAVGTDAAGKLRHVEYGNFICRAPACAGVEVGAANANGGRTFAFRGTSLMEKGSGASAAVLNGNVVLASQ